MSIRSKLMLIYLPSNWVGDRESLVKDITRRKEWMEEYIFTITLALIKIQAKRK